MDIIQTTTVIFSLILIFLFALQKFSHQIHRVAGEKFKSFIARMTDNPIKGLISGATITAVIQSSSATAVVLIGLVNAGIMTFDMALPALIGTNIGTTITAQLVALKMTYIAPIVVIAGFILSHTHSHFRKYGKSVFYFGLIFLSLFLISYFLQPITQNSFFINFIKHEGFLLPILIGAIFTAIVQSSSVVTGIVIILAGENAITLQQGIGIVLGANIGTPITAMIASISASFEAKKVAVAKFLFNIIGVLFFLPIIPVFELLITQISDNLTQQVVNAHFIFNLTTAVLCLTFLEKFKKLTHFATKKITG